MFCWPPAIFEEGVISQHFPYLGIMLSISSHFASFLFLWASDCPSFLIAHRLTEGQALRPFEPNVE
jgi:hypothetical protein